MTLDYFYGQAGELFSFFRIPKALFQEQRFQDLSTDAKTLYGILLDRMSLSVKNEWFDKQGRVFIIFTIEDVKRALCCADNKATKLLRELENFGLIKKTCISIYIDKREQLPSSFVLHQYLKVSTEENIFSSGAALVQGLMKVHGKSISQKDFRDRINYVKRKSNWKDADFQTWRLILKRVLSNSAESLDDFIRSEEGGEFEIF